MNTRKVPTKVNMNNYCYVKLTEHGLAVHKKDHDDLYAGSLYKPEYTAPEPDEDGYYKFQLWSFAQIFGKSIGMRFDKIIETTEILVEVEQ